VVLVLIASIVTILVMMNNQQVTNSHIDLVGTSETLRVVSFLLTNSSTHITNTIHTSHTSNTSNLYDKPNILNICKNTSENNKFNEWLAGVIDGGGSFLVSKSGYSSCEITMDKLDYHTLMLIKNKLGGSVKLRSGVNAYRYRLHNREGMIQLVNMVNGNIRNSKRIPAFIKVCTVLNINYIPASPKGILTTSNA
jgi:ubiquinol-cytochrome c reductase cytochrome b subunit